MQTDRVRGSPAGRVAVLDDEDRHPIQLCLLGSFRLLRRGQVVAVRRGRPPPHPSVVGATPGRSSSLVGCMPTARLFRSAVRKR